MPITFEITSLHVAAAIIGILSIARLTRLLTQDTFPPAVWFRIKWDTITKEGAWAMLAHCHFCLAPWIAIPIGAWALLSDFHWSWWLFNGWLAVAYLASMVVHFDEGKD